MMSKKLNPKLQEALDDYGCLERVVEKASHYYQFGAVWHSRPAEERLRKVMAERDQKRDIIIDVVREMLVEAVGWTAKKYPKLDIRQYNWDGCYIADAILYPENNNV